MPRTAAAAPPLQPEPSRAGSAPLSAAQVERWHARGFIFVAGLWPDALVAEVPPCPPGSPNSPCSH
jgi:hypothetical protein